ncbi:sugar phosphate isomerase/epimerase family protein [Alicyclobacillus vulcanalis]|uniref:Sugar phosphate isomerase/epimerase n=1 Tax=Alicyclobacillus vulcanalis TaxID=252246 RepID=A0A1N7PBM9_9BACL|nr:sugar phosphate isomerase/epimerase family protein [Alicyclobacillus vulcanalis]SIT07907.1 Sugar phosphate isomerase/epimerase [Alicyclobacillus vulcanalis]
MEPCLHPTLVDETSLVPYLDLARETGYRYVDVPFSWLEAEAERHGEAYLEDLFRARGLVLANLGLPVNLYESEPSFLRELALLPDRARLCARLGARGVTTFLWPSVDEAPVRYISQLARRIRQVAVELMPLGMRVGLEYVGPHHLRGRTYPFVQSLADLKTFWEAVGAPNVGVLADSYHWYTAGESEDDLAELPAEKIVYVHINDTNDAPQDAHDGRRLMPGDGCIPLVSFLRGLYRAGYRGPVAAEVLHEAPLGGTGASRALRVRERLESLIQLAKGER